MFRQDEVEQQLTELLEVERLSLGAESDVALHLHLVEEDCLEVGWRVVLVPGVLEHPDVGGDVVQQLGGEVAGMNRRICQTQGSRRLIYRQPR